MEPALANRAVEMQTRVHSIDPLKELRLRQCGFQLLVLGEVVVHEPSRGLFANGACAALSKGRATYKARYCFRARAFLEQCGARLFSGLAATGDDGHEPETTSVRSITHG